MSSFVRQTDQAGPARRLPWRTGDARLPAIEADAVVAVDWPAVAAAFRAGDAAAAEIAVSEVLAAQVLPYVAQLVRRLNAWKSDHDDLVQDILVTTLTRRHTFRGDAKLQTWITRIAINACRAHRRKEWLRRRLFAAWLRRQSPPREPLASDNDNPQAQLVQNAVAALPAKDREAVVLCYLQGHAPADAAESLGITRNALDQRLKRARAQLQTNLQALTPDS
jgi:RNA polymerase sigma factor (sigma-70 family)